MAEKILVVDDDQETLRLISLMLQRQGYQIVAAANGTEAITLANAEMPALIVLDIMMPDLDGYEVTKEIRNNPKISHIPVLMFTALGQVEDKVVGYEVGADDYLTKPVHPAELVAHVKSLLGRSRTRPPLPSDKGYVIAVVAPRGGMGASTLTLNLAISYYTETKQEVIAAEMRPGNGSWAMDLGLSGIGNLENLLNRNVEGIDAEAVENELLRTSYGVRLLVSSNQMDAFKLVKADRQMQTLVRQLALMAPLVLLDIGACYLSETAALLELCDETILITEPYPWAVSPTCQRIKELRERGFGSSRGLTVVMNNRIRGGLQLTATQLSEKIGEPITIGFPPSPEIAYQANLRSAPLITIQPDGLLAKQYQLVAQALAERVQR